MMQRTVSNATAWEGPATASWAAVPRLTDWTLVIQIEVADLNLLEALLRSLTIVR